MDILKGIITGLILSLPFGPVGIYCMQLVIIEGRWKGYVTALGMITIDIFYSMLALCFVKSVDDLIIKYERSLTMLIGIFLIAVALKNFIFNVEIKELDVKFESLIKNYCTGILFALANISSIVSITGIFSVLKVYTSTSSTLPLEIAIGVGLGGASLWFITTSIILHFKSFMRKEKLIKLVKTADYIILFSGIFILLNGYFRFVKF